VQAHQRELRRTLEAARAAEAAARESVLLAERECAAVERLAGLTEEDA